MRKFSIFIVGIMTLFTNNMLAEGAFAQTIPNPTGLGLPDVSGATVGNSNYNFDWASNMNTAAKSVTRGSAYTGGDLRSVSYSGDANISSVSNHVSAQGGGTVGAGTAFKGGDDSVRRSGSVYVDAPMSGNRGGDAYETVMRTSLTLPQTYATAPHGLIPANKTGSGAVVLSAGTGSTASVGKVENQGGKMKYDKVDPEAEDILARFTKGKK